MNRPMAIGSPETGLRPPTDVLGSLSQEVPSDRPTEQLGFELAREMRHRWRSGERPLAEELLGHHPQLWQHPEIAVDLIYEEYCQRNAAGQENVEQDIFRRFPQWAAPLRVMLDCHRRVLQSQRDQPRFPAIGDCLGDFRLIAELARGSRGRVFLAAETALADRPMVLKITPLDGGEHRSLARLQHTNIVPLYSVLDDGDRNIRILCMPYFGCATLASLLESMANVPFAQRTGRQIVNAIDRLQQSSSPAIPASAARQMLASVSHVQAMCWITACLADALQFAHERGLVHLDLKPSNILLASDGQPMLLDFHLAREPIRSGGPLPESFGGTPPYMPPEQRRAMQSLQDGGSLDVTVDGRADVYALGAMLHEALGGQLPITAESPPLALANPRVSRGLSDIVARCVADRQEDRYSSAAAMAEDLRRHLTDQPLTGVPNRSVAERWNKWRRRRPSAFRAARMFLIVGSALAIMLTSVWLRMHDRHEQAEFALHQGQRQLQADHAPAQAMQSFERGLKLVESMPFEKDLRQQLRDQLAMARRLYLAAQLHQLADEVRVLYASVDAIPAGRLRSLAGQCGAFWQKRSAIMDSLKSASDSDAAADLKDIAIFASRLHVKLATDSAPSTERSEAARLLDEAEAMFGPSAVLDQERKLHRLDSGIRQMATATAPRSAWEHCALGRALLASGDLPKGAEELAAALKLDPAGRWPNFYYGLCAYRMGRHEEAVAAFSVCIGAAPDVAGYYYNRALAYMALSRSAEALRDYDRALQLDPAHAAAALNRGVIHFQQKRLDQAEADLRLALDHGADAATVHYDLALIHVADNEPAVALDHLRQALQQNPNHEQARQLRDTLEKRSPRP